MEGLICGCFLASSSGAPSPPSPSSLLLTFSPGRQHLSIVCCLPCLVMRICLMNFLQFYRLIWRLMKLAIGVQPPVPHPTPCIFFAIPTDSLPLLFCIDYTYAVWSQANCFGRWQLPAPNIWLIPYLKSPIWTNNAFYILYEQEKTFAANIFW